MCASTYAWRFLSASAKIYRFWFAWERSVFFSCRIVFSSVKLIHHSDTAYASRCRRFVAPHILCELPHGLMRKLIKIGNYRVWRMPSITAPFCERVINWKLNNNNRIERPISVMKTGSPPIKWENERTFAFDATFRTCRSATCARGLQLCGSTYFSTRRAHNVHRRRAAINA